MRKISVTVAIALAASTEPGVAQIEAHESAFRLTPLVNAVQADDDRLVDDDAGFTLAAGIEPLPNWHLELNLFRARLDGPEGDALDLSAAGINALRVFRRSTRVAPYALVGIGSQRKERPAGRSSTDAYADLGVGLLVALRRSPDSGRALALRVDLRARHDDADQGGRLDRLLGVGLQYTFGRAAAVTARQPETATALPAPPSDSRDADGDGVVDGRDRCAATPRGATVGADGCVIDSDADGVADAADACPSTPPGTRIDVRGCELRQEIRLPGVTFEHDSDRLLPEAFAALDEAAATLEKNADLRIEVAGYTDSTGPAAYNQALSQRRAEAVRRYLLERGVSNELAAHGYGERDPIDDNSTDQGRAQNRRVVLRILSP